jgi:hypothetical protein
MHLFTKMIHSKSMDSRFGLFLLNINYFVATKLLFNVRWRKTSAKTKKGLLVGGVMKYFMAV